MSSYAARTHVDHLLQSKGLALRAAATGASTCCHLASIMAACQRYCEEAATFPFLNTFAGAVRSTQSPQEQAVSLACEKELRSKAWAVPSNERAAA